MKDVRSREQPPSVRKHDNRRRDVRLHCNPTTVNAHVTGREQPFSARVVEVSKSGLQLDMDEYVPVGARVRIDLGDLTIQGEIRHSYKRPDNSYVVGVMTLDTMEKS